MDDIMIVQVFHSFEDRPEKGEGVTKVEMKTSARNHSNRVFFGELSSLQYPFKKLSTSGKFEW